MIIEEAVNDLRHPSGGRNSGGGWSEDAKEIASCMESVIMQLRAVVPRAAVILLEITCSRLRDETAETVHAAVASYHDIPILSLKAGLLPYFMNVMGTDNWL